MLLLVTWFLGCVSTPATPSPVPKPLEPIHVDTGIPTPDTGADGAASQ